MPRSSVRSRSKGRLWATVVGAIAIVGGASWYLFDSEPHYEGVDSANYANVKGTFPASVYQCARCHMLPTADLIPRDRWPLMLERMHRLINAHGEPLTEEQRYEIYRYYVGAAPKQADVLPESYASSPPRFERRPIGPHLSDGPSPHITALTATDLDGDGSLEVLVSDAKFDQVQIGRMTEGKWKEERLASVESPALTAVADLNGDGVLDVAIASLGGLKPTDELIGTVVLMLSRGDKHRKKIVLRKVARVSDVRAVDIDGDGDQDLLVAAFGLARTGSVGWLENKGDSEFEYHEILARSGFSHAIPMHLDGDDRIDFATVCSQEHEEVIGFVNKGGGKFDPRMIYKAPHPMYGLSGLKVVDMDRDGDSDLLVTNGDSLDLDSHPKTWHGVQWLENKGDVQFEFHDILRFYGAYTSDSADLDGDGDIDVVVTSMMNYWQDPARQSIVWLENDGSQNFQAHSLANNPTSLISLAVADFTGDGAPDVLAGSMFVMPGTFQRKGRIALWVNKGGE